VEQKQFQIYWKKGSDNLADYFTKHHPASHHQRMRSRYLQQPDGAKHATRQPDGANHATQQRITFDTNTIFKEVSTLRRHTLNDPDNQKQRLEELANDNQPEQWTQVQRNSNTRNNTSFQAAHCEGVLNNEGITSSPQYSQNSEPPLQHSNGSGAPPRSVYTDRYWLVTANDHQYLLDM
jgi:hypothetical protein